MEISLELHKKFREVLKKLDMSDREIIIDYIEMMIGRKNVK